MHVSRQRTFATYRGPAFKLAGLIVPLLLLAGCLGMDVQGLPGASGAPASRTPGAPASAALAPGVSTAEAGQGWRTAADVTVTPAPAGSDQGPADNATPSPDDQAQTITAVQFTGTVENVPGGNNWEGAWRIGGHTVYVSPSTVVDQQRGRLGQGAQVSVEGWSRPDGAVDAGWLHVLSGVDAGTPAPAVGGPNVTPPVGTATPVPATPQPLAGTATPVPATPQPAASESENDDQSWNRGGRQIVFRGVIEDLPASGLVGDWRVDGRVIHVSSGTRIRQQHWALGTGALVQLHGWQQPDGSIDASSIDTKNPRSAGGPEHPGNGNDKGNGNGNGNGNGKGGGD